MKSFEEQINSIKEILDILENGNLSLDDSLTKFEEGTKLIKECYKKLEDVKKNIKIIVDENLEELEYKEIDIINEEE